MELNVIHNINCLEGLKQLPDESVDCCITSPPYWGLRDYGVKGQIGQEKTPGQYTDNIVAVFAEVFRILKPAGTLWLNIGDSYCSTAPGTMGDPLHISECAGDTKDARKKFRPHTPEGMKPKDLVGIPWMVAFALRSHGWYLRQEIIWCKAYSTLEENFGAVMPESVTDRFVKAHESLFLLSKSRKYYFDIAAIKKQIKESSVKRLNQNIEAQKGSSTPSKGNGPMKAAGKLMARDGTNVVGHSGDIQKGDTANKRSVWHHLVSSFPGAHFATFPEELIVDCVKAGCPEGGVVLDPFMGSGTTAIVAAKNNRNFIGFELNPEYLQLSIRRLQKELGMFNPLYKAI